MTVIRIGNGSPAALIGVSSRIQMSSVALLRLAVDRGDSCLFMSKSIARMLSKSARTTLVPGQADALA
jgi:hypothetical protein